MLKETEAPDPNEPAPPDDDGGTGDEPTDPE